MSRYAIVRTSNCHAHSCGRVVANAINDAQRYEYEDDPSEGPPAIYDTYDDGLREGPPVINGTHDDDLSEGSPVVDDMYEDNPSEGLPVIDDTQSLLAVR